MTDIKLERSFVAACYHNRRLVRKFPDLSPDDFQDFDSRRYWQALVSGEPIVDFTIYEPPLAEDEAPAAVQRIRKNAWLRRVHSWADRLKVLAERKDEEKLSDLLARSPLLAEEHGVQVEDALNEIQAALMTDTLVWELKDPRLAPLGYLFYPGSITVIGATPGTGKSALAEQILLDLTEQGAMALDISVELSAEVRTSRYMQHLVGSGVTYRKLLAKTYDPEALHRGMQLLRVTSSGATRKLIIDPSSVSLDMVLASVQSFHQQYLAHKTQLEAQGMRTGPPVVLVDFLQAVSVETKTEGIYERMSLLAERLYALGKHLGLAMVWLSQLKKRDYSRKMPPNRSDIEGSGRVEQYAHTLSLLFTPPDATITPAGREVHIYTPKARLGNVQPFLTGVFNGDTLNFDFSLT